MALIRTGFQSFVNNELPNGVPGDPASANPRASVVGGPNAYAAPAAGTTVGVFAWFDPNTGIASNYFKPNAFLGFVRRVGQALITQFLGIASMQIVAGDMVTGENQGDFYGLFAGGAAVGQKVYADPVTGALTAANTGGTVTGTNTGASVSASVLTTTDADAAGSATAVGQSISGGTLPEGTYIASSAGTGSGTHLWNLANANGTAVPNNAGPFTSVNNGVQETNFSVASAVDPGFSVASSSIAPDATGYAGVLTLGANVSGSGNIAIGDWISGTGIPANVQVLALLSGTANQSGATYAVSWAGTVGPITITGTQGQIGAITSWGQA